METGVQATDTELDCENWFFPEGGALETSRLPHLLILNGCKRLGCTFVEVPESESELAATFESRPDKSGRTSVL